VAQERAYSTDEINGAVRKHLSPSKPVKIGGLDGHHGVLAGLTGKGRVTVSGSAGDYLGAFLDGPEVTLSGSAGDFAGSTMVSGRLIVEGTVGTGMCCHMAGGEARVKGRVGAGAGSMMTDGLLVLDAPVGPGPGEGMTGGTMILLRPNHIPKTLPPTPARVIVPRGTTKDVKGLGEMEMDHQEVEDLAASLGEVGVATPDKVADLLVVLVPEDQATLPAAAPAPGKRKGKSKVKTGVTLDLGGDEPKEKKGTASTRFANFAKEIHDEEGS
jgi:hypothetical protein